MQYHLALPNLKNIPMGKWRLINGPEHPSGSTKTYENTFDARLIHVPIASQLTRVQTLFKILGDRLIQVRVT